MKIEIELIKKQHGIELNIIDGLFTSCILLDPEKPLPRQVGSQINSYLKERL